MVAKTNHIKKLANSLIRKGQKMTFDQLAADLNANGFKPRNGTSYKGGRGAAKVVDAVHWRLEKLGLTKDSDNVRKSFTDKNKKYAY